jgi:acetyltransferase
VSQIVEVATPKEAYEKAGQFKSKMVLKILSPDITHKSDSGGVVLNLKSPKEVEEAATKMLENYKVSHPTANIQGFALQEMVERSSAHELILGLAEDPVFGPVILFGSGGKAVEMIQDKTLAIPPLTPELAHEIIRHTRIYKLLKGYRDEPAANISAIIKSLVNLSELIIDLPMVKELDINPLLADKDGVIALDARIKITNNLNEHSHLVISPYPHELSQELSLPEYTKLILRPVKPKDITVLDTALTKLMTSQHELFTSVFQDEPNLLSTRLTHVDYDQEITMLCINKSYAKEILGIAYIKMSLLK